MRWWPFKRRGPAGPRSFRRSFVTPEGVDLGLELASASARAIAFVLDFLLIVILLVTVTILAGLTLSAGARSEVIAILWLLGSFFLRNGWFTLFEMGGRGATPGKRLMGLRVVARDGARLTGSAVVARNAMREVELFLPLSFLAQQNAAGSADAFLTLFALGWSGILLLFPLFNRDRLRTGDLIAGTWVVNIARRKLGTDLSHRESPAAGRVFSEAALNLYGIYELQTLENVLRTGNEAAVAVVAGTIRRKAGIPDDPDDRGFLTEYYTALCAHLEQAVVMGRRRESKDA